MNFEGSNVHKPINNEARASDCTSTTLKENTSVKPASPIRRSTSQILALIRGEKSAEHHGALNMIRAERQNEVHRDPEAKSRTAPTADCTAVFTGAANDVASRHSPSCSVTDVDTERPESCLSHTEQLGDCEADAVDDDPATGVCFDINFSPLSHCAESSDDDVPMTSVSETIPHLSPQKRASVQEPLLNGNPFSHSDVTDVDATRATTLESDVPPELFDIHFSQLSDLVCDDKRDLSLSQSQCVKTKAVGDTLSAAIESKHIVASTNPMALLTCPLDIEQSGSNLVQTDCSIQSNARSQSPLRKSPDTHINALHELEFSEDSLPYRIQSQELDFPWHRSIDVTSSAKTHSDVTSLTVRELKPGMASVLL